MLGVFLLPAFTHLGHKRQDFFSPCDGMQVLGVRRLNFHLYSHLKEFYGMESESMLREKSPLPEAQRRVEPATLHHHTGQQAQHTTD